MASSSDERPVAISAVIFDLDGTLIDYETVSHVALEKALVDKGLISELPWDLHGSIVGLPSEGWSKKILAGLNIAEETYSWQDYVHDYEKQVPALANTVCPWPEVEKVLAYLKNELKVPLAIATSSHRTPFCAKMSESVMQEKIMRFFGDFTEKETFDVMDKDYIVTGDEIKRGKPNPDIFLEAARRLGVDPKECLVFEDSPHGVRGAEAAGMYTVALPDPRFVEVTTPMFAELNGPTWTLPKGIGSFMQEVVEKGQIRKKAKYA